MKSKIDIDNPGLIKEVIIGVCLLIIFSLIALIIGSDMKINLELLNPFATLMGAFLGALIAGLIATKIGREQNRTSLQIAQEQNEFMKQTQQTSEKAKTLKTIINIRSFSVIYSEKMKTINIILRNEKGSDNEDLFRKLDYIFNSINEQYLSFFNQVDWLTIDKEDLTSVALIREIGNSITEDYYLYKVVEKLKPPEIAMRWEEKLNDLNKIIHKLEEKYKLQSNN